MVMPLAGRVVAAVAGGLLVLVAVSSVTVTLIRSRPVRSRRTRWVDQIVDWAYEQVAGRVADARRRDQLRATQAAAVLLGQLAAWLAVAYEDSPCCCGRSPPAAWCRPSLTPGPRCLPSVSLCLTGQRRR